MNRTGPPVDTALRFYDADVMIHDRAQLPQVLPDIFDPVTWRSRDILGGTASGRGATWLVANDKHRWVLRHYRRGGWLARLRGDRYCWFGLRRSRPWREWHILVALWERGLPVPRPVAARVRRGPLTYTADLITEYLSAQALSAALLRGELSAAHWRRVGAVLADFHRAGVVHADLNAHNILLDEDGGVFVIDFDRARWRSPVPHARWQRANLARLKRSLRKLKRETPAMYFDERAWDRLVEGYEGKV